MSRKQRKPLVVKCPENAWVLILIPAYFFGMGVGFFAFAGTIGTMAAGINANFIVFAQVVGLGVGMGSTISGLFNIRDLRRDGYFKAIADHSERLKAEWKSNAPQAP